MKVISVNSIKFIKSSFTKLQKSFNTIGINRKDILQILDLINYGLMMVSFYF